jgi:hypothetical protein
MLSYLGQSFIQVLSFHAPFRLEYIIVSNGETHVAVSFSVQRQNRGNTCGNGRRREAEKGVWRSV